MEDESLASPGVVKSAGAEGLADDHERGHQRLCRPRDVVISVRREEERDSVETRGRPTPDALASAQGAALIAAPRARGATGRLRGAQTDRRVYRGPPLQKQNGER